jgi:hypothetical protein
VSTSSRGASRERQVRKQLEAEGWAVTRGAGSHGCADLWAAREASRNRPLDHPRRFTRLLLIQVKTDKAGPYGHFGPADRKELLSLAAQTGGIPELCWWPANGKQQWIPADEWPT